MSRRHYGDDTDSDVDLPRSGRGRATATRRGSGDFGKPRKEASRPWTQEESDWLISVVARAATTTNYDAINWQDVAKQVPGRTGKQCREKWKNDLRPNICKEAWSLKEEYVLALAHSLHGNRWSEVAKYLPTRPENTIKNRWYATNRAKAEVKIRTFLWLYSDLVDRQAFPAGPEAIDRARDAYRQLPDVVPLEEFEVSVDFYTQPEGGTAVADTRPEIKIIGRGKAKPHVPGATMVGGGSGAAPRGGGAAGRASRAAAAAAAATAARAASGSTPSSGAAAGLSVTNRGGAGSGGGHSEGDANCYVKVGGLAGDLPAVGSAVKATPQRKRKASSADNAAAAAAADAAADRNYPIKTEPGMLEFAAGPSSSQMLLMVPGVGGGMAASGSGAAPSPLGGRGTGSSGGGQSPLDPEVLWQNVMEGFSGSPARKVPRLGGPCLSAGGRGGSSGGSHITASAGGGLYPGGPGGGGGGTAAAAFAGLSGPGGAGGPFADPESYHSMLPFYRLPGSDGGASAGGAPPHPYPHPHLGHLHPHYPSHLNPHHLHGSGGDVLAGLFPPMGMSLMGMGPDGGRDGGGGGGSEGGAGDAVDADMFGMADGLDLASLTALIGAQDGSGEAAGGDMMAHDAMASLHADVLSHMQQLPPSMLPPHLHHAAHHHPHPHHHAQAMAQQEQQQQKGGEASMPRGGRSQQHQQQHQQQQEQEQRHGQQQQQHQQQQGQQQQQQSQQQQQAAPLSHPPPLAALSHAPHTVTTLPPQLQPSAHQPHVHPSHYHPLRHATSHGSALQQHSASLNMHPHAHPHSMSQGSYPLQSPPQSLLQPHDSGATAQLPVRGSLPLPPAGQQQQQGMQGGGPSRQPSSGPDAAAQQQQQPHQQQSAQGQSSGSGAALATAVVAAAASGPHGHPFMLHPRQRMPSGHPPYMYGPPPPGYPGAPPPGYPHGPPPGYSHGHHPSMLSGRVPLPPMHAQPGGPPRASAAGYPGGPPPPGYPGGPPPGYPGGPPPGYYRAGYYKVGGRPGMMARGMVPYSPYGMPLYPHGHPHGLPPPGYPMEHPGAGMPPPQQQQQQAGDGAAGSSDGTAGPYTPVKAPPPSGLYDPSLMMPSPYPGAPHHPHRRLLSVRSDPALVATEAAGCGSGSAAAGLGGDSMGGNTQQLEVGVARSSGLAPAGAAGAGGGETLGRVCSDPMAAAPSPVGGDTHMYAAI